jgi:glutamate synthase (NADPH/NADH) large chain
VVLGCIMMRVCHLNTCPVGIATQDPELRKRFAANADHVVNFFRFLAREVREYMAQLGFRTMADMIGRVDQLDFTPALDHWKARGLDLSSILYQPDMPADVARRCVRPQDHGLEKSLDATTIIPRCREALEERTPVELSLPIRNVNRTVGTTLGYEVTTRWGGEGLPDDTIRIHFNGSAGQSFAAFVPRGITFTLEGDANDYWGKGLSGGKLSVYPPRRSTFVPEDNIVIGNVALYGATSGEAYVRGVAGERFCVRNSGAYAVVEGVGDHACEYMTGGRVVVLGRTGRNFGAGMSGGVGYVLDLDGNFKRRCNPGMIELEPFDKPEDINLVRDLIGRHIAHTGSTYAAKILERWVDMQPRFVKIMPRDYKRVLQAEAQARAEGREPTFAELVGATSG